MSSALQSVFLVANPKRDDPPTPTFCYDRSVLRQSHFIDAYVKLFGHLTGFTRKTTQGSGVKATCGPIFRIYARDCKV